MTRSGALGNAGPAFKQDIVNDEFDKYLLFTYGLDTSLCSWFNADDEVVVCGPEDQIHEVADLDVATSISSQPIQSHAKLYLMWGEDRIVCWLGSFNFTFAGIYNNVEWAARFAGSLERVPELSALLAGNADARITDSWQIQQALELVASTFSGSDTTNADALLKNTTYPYVLVHSHRSNTLKRALQHELKAAAGRVTLTYYSPFVNARGIDLFLQTLEPVVRRENIHLTVRTCRLNNISDQDTGLNSGHVSRFKKELNGFEYHVRAPGSQGDQLRDGSELRSGLAHHKTIGVSFVDHNGDEQRVTLLTTANLTKNAWQHHSGNFEIGLLLRDDDRNDELHELLGFQLAHCYERPRESELDEAVSESSERASFEEMWLEDLLSEGISLSEKVLNVQWDDTLPPIESLTATLYYRDILSGERSPKTVTLSTTEDGFQASIPSLESTANRVIDFIEFDVETSFRPPEYRFTSVGITRLQSGELSLDEIDGELIHGGKAVQQLETFDAKAQAPDNLRIREMYEEPRTVKVVHEPREHPHLAAKFIQEVTVGTVTDADFGGYVYLDARVDSEITPRPEQLLLRHASGGRIEYLGYAYPDSHTVRYYFDADHSDTDIEVTLAPPLDRYYPSKVRSRRLPSVSTQTVEPVRAFARSALVATPYGEGSSIDEETPIEFHTNLDAVPRDAPIQVQWGLRGYDRFGESLDIDEVLSPQEPHRQIWFRGSIDLSVAGTTMTLLTRRGAETIFAQPFAQTLKPRKDLFPNHIDIKSLSHHQLLAWLVFDRDDLLKPAVRDTEKHLKVDVSQAGHEYAKVICPILDDGELLCIPLLGRQRNTTIELKLELKLQGGRPEVAYYAPRSIQFEMKVDTAANSITLDWKNDSHVITHEAMAGQVTLNALADRVNSSELYSMLHPGDPFELRARDGLTLRVREPGLLHLYGQQ